jgi:hypothetical protein
MVRAWLVALGALVCAPACGAAAGRAPETPDAGASAAADGPTDAGRAPDLTAAADGGLGPDEFVARFCALVAPCCGAAALPAGGDGCRARLTASTAGRPFRAPTAASCLAALELATGTAAFCTAGYAVAARLCDRVFAVVVASQRLGEACATAEECVLSADGPVVCAGVTAAARGRCQVKLRGREDDLPCVGTVDGALTVAGGDPGESAARAYLCHVADGLWCEDATRRCLKARAPGAACASFGECGPTHHCDDASARCTPRKERGSACTVDEECQSVFCGEDNRCGGAPVIDGALAALCGQR